MDGSDNEGFRNVHNNITITNSEFRKCTGIKGGGLYCDSFHIHINNCIFNENNALYGGDIYLIAPANCSINGSSCTESTAKTITAGIVIDNSVVLTSLVQQVKQVNLSKLMAPSATAIDVWSGNPKITYSKISDCLSTYNSACMRTSSKHGTIASVFDTIFKNNTKSGAYIVYWFQSEANIERSQFYNNKAEGKAGNSIYSYNNQVKISITDSYFSGSQETELYIKSKTSSISLKSGNKFGIE